MAIGDKKASLIRNDGSNITLNKPITIPSSVTDISQITEAGWYHGSFAYSVNKDGDNVTDTSNVKNTPAIKIKDELTSGTSYGYDVFVAGTGDYIFNLETSVFYGKKLANANITWYKVSPLVKDWLDSEDTESALSANCGRLLKEELDTKSDNDHVHNRLTRTEDTRDTATKPSDYNNEFKFVGIKTEKALGLSKSESWYVALFGVNQWSDSSGGGATEIAISDSGEMYIRHQPASSKYDEFGEWEKIIKSYDVIDGLTNTSTILPLSANQGKVLDEKKLDKVDGFLKTIDDSVTSFASITTPGWYTGETSMKLADTLVRTFTSTTISDFHKIMPGYVGTTSMGTMRYKLIVLSSDGEYILSTSDTPYYKTVTTSDADGDHAGETLAGTYRASVFRGVKSGSSISWKLNVLKDLDGKLDKPKTSTTDLTAGTSNLTTGQFYFVYE